MEGNNQIFDSWGETTREEATIFEAKHACCIESIYICNQINQDSGIKLYLKKLIESKDEPEYKIISLARGNLIKKADTIQFIQNGAPIFLAEGDIIVGGLTSDNLGSFVISYRYLLSQKTSKDESSQTDSLKLDDGIDKQNINVSEI